MPPLTSIYSSAHRGMSIAQSAAALVSRNIANAQTPYYAREILPLSEALGGLAVMAGPPQALRATLLEHALQGATGRTAYFDAQLPHLSLAEAAVNDLDGVGLGKRLDDFRAALAALSANPSGQSERRALIATGEALGAAFASTRRQLDGVAVDIEHDARATAEEINTLTAQIAALDQRIRAARAGDEANTYRSQRAALLGTLAGLTDIDVRLNADGSTTVSTAGGRALVEGGQATRVVVEAMAPPARGIEIAFERPDGARLEAIAGAELGGKLGGLMHAHEHTVVAAVDALDQLAFDFVSTFNATHAGGFTADGTPAGAFFTAPTAVAGAAAAVALSAGLTADEIGAALDPALAPGDNGNLLRMIEVARDDGAWRSLSREVSQAVAGVEAAGDFERESRTQLENLFASATGVSIDEEMFALTQAQAALEASSRVIGEAQRMTDTVLGLVG